MLILSNKKLFYLLLGLFTALFLLRANALLLPGILAAHISNFAITGGIYLLSDYPQLLKKGFTRKSLLLAMLPFALVNVVMELFVRVDTIRLGTMHIDNFNTPDPVDMVFGFAALLVIYICCMRYAVHK